MIALTYSMLSPPGFNLPPPQLGVRLALGSTLKAETVG